MGYIAHHAIICTSCCEKAIAKAHQFALMCCDGVMPVTPVTHAAVNGYRSFMIAPDGSKEGWPASDRCDGARDAFMDHEHEHCEIVEVLYGLDDGNAIVSRHRCGPA